MRSKLDYLITLSLKRKMKTKWFLITNILVAILIIGLINIDSIITLFGGDFNKKTKLYVIDNTNEAYELFKTELDNSSKLLNEESGYEVYRYDKTIDYAMEELKEKDNYDNYYLEFSYLDDYSLKVKLVTKEYIDIYDTQILNNALNNTKVSLSISHSNISIEELNKIYEPVNVDRVYLDEKKNSAEENMEMIMSSVFPIIILPVFMLIVFLVQMIGAEINEEKPIMSITSGGCHILFDGTYTLKDVVYKDGRKVPIIAFNDKNSLNQKPDSNYVYALKNKFIGGFI